MFRRRFSANIYAYGTFELYVRNDATQFYEFMKKKSLGSWKIERHIFCLFKKYQNADVFIANEVKNRIKRIFLE